jgi:hypothetical protein
LQIDDEEKASFDIEVGFQPHTPPSMQSRKLSDDFGVLFSF